MRKQTTYLLFILLFCLTFSQIIAQAKNVAYVTKTKTLTAPGASTVSNDAIIRMLNDDPNFNVTVLEDDGIGSSNISINNYDLIIVQETFGSNDNVLKPAGLLAIKNFTKPVIYNKSYAFINGRAISSSVTVAPDNSVTSITVPLENQSNLLFSNIDFSGGGILQLFNESTDDNGASGTKGIITANNLDFNGVNNTLLATSADVVDATKAVVINDIPGGTQLGTAPGDVLPLGSRMIAFGFNYGAIARGNGTNMTADMLTIWKNAAYILTGMEASLSIDKAGDVSNVSSNVRAIGNRIYVSNVTSATEVNIYSITGALVKSLKTNTDTDFNFKSGLWIATVKTFEGAKAVKLLTK